MEYGERRYGQPEDQAGRDAPPSGRYDPWGEPTPPEPAVDGSAETTAGITYPDRASYLERGRYPEPTTDPQSVYVPEPALPQLPLTVSEPHRPISGPPFSTSGPPYPTSGPPYPSSSPPYPTSVPPYPSSSPPYPTSAPPSSEAGPSSATQTASGLPRRSPTVGYSASGYAAAGPTATSYVPASDAAASYVPASDAAAGHGGSGYSGSHRRGLVDPWSWPAADPPRPESEAPKPEPDLASLRVRITEEGDTISRSARRSRFGEEPAYRLVLTWTAGWFCVPLVFYLIWLVTLDGERMAMAAGQLVRGLPWLIAALAASAGVAALLRWAVTGWRAVTLAFASAVIGSGMVTIAHSLTV